MSLATTAFNINGFAVGQAQVVVCFVITAVVAVLTVRMVSMARKDNQQRRAAELEDGDPRDAA